MNRNATGKSLFTQKSKIAFVCLLLAGGIWVVFGQTLRQEFVGYDDEEYVSDNPEVHRGLSLRGICWAFTHVVSANWHPLTMISHMLAWQVFGAWAGGHHLVNVLLHLATVILLFLVLREMTGALWRSAFVAALFAIHPLRVESVAWISERKDVLSGVFFMLTLWAYIRYARNRPSLARYLILLLCFALGLMCKPTLVTLPFVLLLLDYWPLNRFASPARRLAEKVPLFALSAASCLATLLAQRGIISPVETPPFSLRLGNAVVSYAAYIGQMFYPVTLAVFYPFPAMLPLWEIALALGLLASISLAAVLWRKKYPFFLVGWLWYLGMLVPMIGLLREGGKARADRYTYLSQIGLSIAITWGAAIFCSHRRQGRMALGIAGVAVIAGLMICARIQTSYWENGERLWNHTLASTSENAVAHANLGIALRRDGKIGEAIIHYEKAVKIWPGYSRAHYNLGMLYARTGRLGEAAAQYHEAIQSRPDYADAHVNLGNVYEEQRDPGKAIEQYETALQIQPDDALAHYNLGNVLAHEGQAATAINEYRKALEIDPDYRAAMSNLAWVLATTPNGSLRNGVEAIGLAEQANKIAGGKIPGILRILAAAYAEAGRFPDAVKTENEALTIALATRQTALAADIRTRIKLYESGTPYRVPAGFLIKTASGSDESLAR